MHRGVWYSFLSIVLMAIASPLLKIASQNSSVMVVTFYSCLTAFISSLALGFKIKRPAFERKSGLPIFLMSILYTTAMLSFAFASKYENPAIVSLLSRTNTIFSFLISFLYFKEAFNRNLGLAILFIALGTISLLATDTGVALTAGVAAVLFYAVAFSIHNTLLKNLNDGQFFLGLVLQNAFACVSVYILSNDGSEFFNAPVSSIALAAVTGLCSSFLGVIFYRKALALSSFSEATALRSLSPVIAFGVTYPFFPFVFDQYKILGSSAIFLGVSIFCLSRLPTKEKPRIEGYYEYSNEKEVVLQLLRGSLEDRYSSVLDVGAGDGTLTTLLAERADRLHLCEINSFYESTLRSRLPGAKLDVCDIWNAKLVEYDLVHFSQGLYYHEVEMWIPLIDKLMAQLSDDGELILIMNHDEGDWWNAVNSVWTTHPNSLKFAYTPLSLWLNELRKKYEVTEHLFSYDVKFPNYEARDLFIKNACVPIKSGENEAKNLLDRYLISLPAHMLEFRYQSNFIRIKTGSHSG